MVCLSRWQSELKCFWYCISKSIRQSKPLSYHRFLTSANFSRIRKIIKKSSKIVTSVKLHSLPYNERWQCDAENVCNCFQKLVMKWLLWIKLKFNSFNSFNETKILKLIKAFQKNHFFANSWQKVFLLIRYYCRVLLNSINLDKKIQEIQNNKEFQVQGF